MAEKSPTPTPDILRNTNKLPYTTQEHNNAFIAGHSLFYSLLPGGYGTREFLCSSGDEGPLYAIHSASTPEVVLYRREFFDELMENRRFSKAFGTATRSVPNLIPKIPDGWSIKFETSVSRVKKLASYPEALRQVEGASFAPEVWNELQEYAHEFLGSNRQFVQVADNIRERGVTEDDVKEAVVRLNPFSRGVIDSVSGLRHQMLTYRAFEGIFYSSINRYEPRVVCKPNLTYSGDAHMEMTDMYHPLLTHKTSDEEFGDYMDPVPNNLSIGPDNPMMILTGPNTGGKSGFRMAAQLNTLLVSSGFWAFAKSVEGTPFRRQWSLGELSAKVGEEGTFGSVLDYGAQVRDNATREDLVFFDELDRGTMPADQEWFTRGVLISSAKHRIPTVAISHDLDLVSSLKDNPNISMFRVADYEAGEQRFKIFPGIADAGYGRQKAVEKGMDPKSFDKALTARLGK